MSGGPFRDHGSWPTKFAHDAESYKRTCLPGRHHRIAELAALADKRPTIAADDFDVAVARAHWIFDRRPAVIVPVEPVGTPLPDVAPHVIETEGVGCVTTDR